MPTWGHSTVKQTLPEVRYILGLVVDGSLLERLHAGLDAGRLDSGHIAYWS